MTSTDQNLNTSAISDRFAILDLTARLGLLVDVRDWAALGQLFTNPVTIDYTTLNGGEPQLLDPGDLIDGWRRMLTPLKATQHLIASQVIDIDGDTAHCTANVQATHVLDNASGGSTWTVAGRYDYELARTGVGAGWQISALTLTVEWATGNQHIMTLAGQ